MLVYHCADCGHERDVPETYAGRSAKCPKCGASNQIIEPPPIAEVVQVDTQPPTPRIIQAPNKQADGSTNWWAWSAFVANVLLLAMLGVTAFIGLKLSSTSSATDLKLTTIDGRLAKQFTPERPPQWEYTVEAPDDAKLIEMMDTLGANGWELVAARRATREVKPLLPWNDVRTEASYELIFKRLKR